MISHGCDKGVSVILCMCTQHNSGEEAMQIPVSPVFWTSRMPPKPHISNFTESQNCWGRKESQEIFYSATSAQQGKEEQVAWGRVQFGFKYHQGLILQNLFEPVVKTPSFFLCFNATSSVSICACYLSFFQWEESGFISEDTKRVFQAGE